MLGNWVDWSWDALWGLSLVTRCSFAPGIRCDGKNCAFDDFRVFMCFWEWAALNCLTEFAPVDVCVVDRNCSVYRGRPILILRNAKLVVARAPSGPLRNWVCDRVSFDLKSMVVFLCYNKLLIVDYSAIILSLIWFSRSNAASDFCVLEALSSGCIKPIVPGSVVLFIIF